MPAVLKPQPQPARARSPQVETPAQPPQTTPPAPRPAVSAGTAHAYQRFSGDAFVQGAGDVHKVDPSDVRQGQLGDCWFMSSMIATAKANPDAIERLIKPLGKGQYEVTLYLRDPKTGGKSGRTVVVDDSFPADARKLPAYAQAGDKNAAGRGELWPMLLEKAAATLSDGKYDNLWGGKGSDGLDLLSPHQSRGFDAELSTTRVNGFGRMVKEYTPPEKLAAQLSTAMARGQPITCGNANSEFCDGKRVQQMHVYAVVGVDPKNRTITLQDPNGVTSNTFSLAEFQKTFGYVSVGAPL